MDKKFSVLVLILIFFLGLVLRFLFFPENIYFGFDQARDAYSTLEILNGNLRIIGPPTGVEGLFHGPLYYYFYAPLYYVGQGSPILAAAFLRIASAVAVIVIFLAGWVIFNKRVGFVAAFLAAISFEQTQFALYFNHPSLAVLSMTLFYMGWALLFFRKEQGGLILAALGLGLSLQFEFVLVYLFAIAIALIILFRKDFPKIDKKTLFLSVVALSFSAGTFILAEIKFNFRALTILPSVLESSNGGGGIAGYLNNVVILSTRFVNDNLLAHPQGTQLALIFLVAASLIFLRDSQLRMKAVFLLIWVLGGILPYTNNKSVTPLYYYGVGAGVGLLIFYSFVLSKIWDKWRVLACILIAIPIISNINLIFRHNAFGVIPTINVQSGMLLGDQKRVVDYIYREALGQSYAVSGVTMPLSVNTTWSYLFEWYGKEKYGYVPVWGGDAARGYPGNLQIVNARSTLPSLRFFIIEPTRGIRGALIENMLREEGYFTKVIKEEKIGEFIIQKREPF